jgi:RHS repeat-associated protein
MKTTILKTSIISAALACSLATYAGPTLFITDAVTTAGPISGTNGIVYYSSAAFGDNWSVVVTTGRSKPLIGSATGPNIELTIDVISTGPGNNLSVAFSDDSFGPAFGNFTADLDSHVVSGSGDSMTFNTYYDASNAVLALTSPLTASGPLSGNNSGATFPGGTIGANPFSLTEVVTLGAGTGNGVSYSIGANLQAAGCLPWATGLVGWWQGETNGYEVVSGNNAALYGVGFDQGKVGGAFRFDGASAYAYVPACSNLDVGQGQGLTIECWIKPDDIYNGGPLAAWDDGWGNIAGGLWVNWTDNGALYALLSDTNWNGYPVWSAGGVLTNGTFQHVALTYDKSSGLAVLYYNGNMVATNNLGSFTPLTSLDLYLGGDPNCESYYSGLLDEVGLYSRALLADEIRAIYDAGSLGRCGIRAAFILHPASQSVTEGNDARFTSLATGTSLQYQWRFNGTNLAGATRPDLDLRNVQINRSGTYSVQVSNTLGIIFSSNAVLTVTQAVCYPAPAGLISWWRAESNALDSAGSNNGSLSNGVSFADGKAGQAFSFEGEGGTVVAPDSSSLRLTDQLTIEAWINPRSIDSDQALVSKVGGAAGNNGYQFVLSGNTLLGQFNSPGQNWPSARVTSGGVITTGVWYHVAWTYDQSEMRLYLNGLPIATNAIGAQSIITCSSTLRLSGDDNNHVYFNGLIDEASVYDRALSDEEIAGIYNASIAGKCQDPPTFTLQPVSQNVGLGSNATFTVSATGTPQLHYQWRFNGANLSGATRTSLTLTNVQSAQAGTYTVLVTNAFGSAISTNAVLTVGSAVPVVQMISPTSNQLFITSPTNILLVASATNSGGGTISSVEFYTNNAWLGEATFVSNQYQFLWQNVLPGTYSISVWATNNSGGYASDAATNVIVNAMPVVAITWPTNSISTNLTSFAAPTNLILHAVAWDPDGSGVTVQFFHRSNLSTGAVWTDLPGIVTQTYGTNFFITWTNCPPDTHAVYAVATDDRGASTASSLVVFQVTPTNPPPSVWLIWPTNGASFSDGANITILAGATNSPGGGAVTNVEFFVTGYPLLSPGGAGAGAGSTRLLGSDATAPYSITECCWRPGRYQLLLKATDSLGFSGVSTQISLTIIEALPTGTGFWDPMFHISTDTSPYVDECNYRLTLDMDPSIVAAAVRGPQLYLSARERASYGSGGNQDQHAAAVYQWDGTSWFRWGASAAPCHDFPFIGADAKIPGGQGVGGVAADGSGLFVAGLGFDATTTNYVVKRWDGTNWNQIGASFETGAFVTPDFDTRLVGLEQPRLQFVGTDLFLYGNFVYEANTNVQFIAKWDSASNAWGQVGSPLNAPVYAISSLRGNLVVGGSFTGAGGNSNANHVAQLREGNWTNLGTGVGGLDYSYSYRGYEETNVDAAVFSLAACGTNLFVGGDFTSAGDQTNANGIAVWNGVGWRTIGGGLLAKVYGPSGEQRLPRSENFTNGMVYSISPYGNSVYVGGIFTDALSPGGDDLPVGSIAKALWREDLQQWTWSSLDFGVYIPLGGATPQVAAAGIVLTTATMDGPSPGAYDVIAGGYFVGAGSLLNADYGSVARWRVGYAQPPAAPVVTITNPANLTFYTNLPDMIEMTALATSTYTNIASAEFFMDGASIGGYDNGSGGWSASWYTPSAGPHLVTATATDGAGLKGKSSAVTINIADVNNTVTAVDDRFVVMANDPPTTLNVLANDSTSANSKLRVVQVYPIAASVGTAQVSFDGSSVIYTPNPNTYGTDLYAYVVTDGFSTNSAYVTVKIRAAPFILFQNPGDGEIGAAPTNLVVNGVAFGYDTAITNIAVFANGSFLGQLSPANFNYLSNPTNFFFTLNQGAVSPQSYYAYFSFNWATNLPGYYPFSATLADTYGYTNVSPLTTLVLTNSFTAANHLIASIDNLSGTNNAAGTTDYTVIRDGFFDLRGKARDPISTDPVSYQLLLYLPSTPATAFANVTPPPRDAAGFHSGGDVTNYLGRLDFSGVQNGAYDLVLTVRGGGAETNTTARFLLDTQLKIGQFSFSEQDLVLPVNGIPLTVTRTYNSLNPRSADFGYAWTYSLMGMDVQLDDQRQDVTIGSDQAPFADDEEGDNGLPNVVSIRTGGGWDVSLTLPDGRRTTFAFTPQIDVLNYKAYARWTPPPDVHAKLTTLPGFDTINTVPFSPLYWQDGGDDSTFDNHDIPGWILQTLDGTQYYITRGSANNVLWDSTGAGNYINVKSYGPPALSSIVQRSGDCITIGYGGIFHFAAGPNGTTTTNLTRSVLFNRDAQGRITAISDPNAGPGGLPSVKYIYHADTGNLLQVLKLTDRTAGTYLTTTYHYDNPAFPHYITSIENPLGVPVARNEYDDSGRLTAVVDADGNRTEFHHSTTNSTEVVIDRLGHTNIYAYDLRGNVTATTNALGGITLSAYDLSNNKTNEIAYLGGQPYATNQSVFSPEGFLLSHTDPLQQTVTYAYNAYGQVTNSVDARGYGTTNYYDVAGNLTGTADALGNSTTNVYNGSGLLAWSQDAVGTITTNSYDGDGNLTATATLDASGILSTNSFTFDDNGNRTSSTVWRRVGGAWTGATTTSVYDGQNRVVQMIDPDGGTNTVVYNEIGKQAQTIDTLGRPTSFTYDDQGRLIQTIYPDLFSDSSTYDSNGNRATSTDKLGRVTTYAYDALNRPVQTVYPDNATNSTVYDLLGRVQFSVDARGTVTAFGYDAAGERVAVTNALGMGTTVQSTNGFTFDPNGNQSTSTDALGRTTTSVFDPLNRVVQVLYPDATTTSTGYDSVGRRVAQTNQDAVVTRFGYDGAGRLVAVTNAFGVSAVQMVTQYQYDEAGNQVAQTDALNRTTRFAYDGMGRRIQRTLPGNQAEMMAYDPAGNLILATNFNGAVITNQYDCMNRLTNRASVNGYQVSFAFSPTGQRTNMADASGTTAYLYDSRDRLTNKVVSWSGGFSRALSYGYDANGNVTNILSSTSGGADLKYAYDPLNRITNVLAGGSQAGSYGFDPVGNLQSVRLGNGVTNLYQYDALNRLTNAVWKLGASPLASFYYQLGQTGNRTNLNESLAGSTHTYAWQYDPLYRLTNETISGLGSLSYALDPVGNRTNRLGSGSVTNTLPPVTSAFGANDWLTTDAYDNNGNTLWTTNGASATGPYYYDVENRLTNFNNSVGLTYNGEGLRVKKTLGDSVGIFYVLDDRNPSGYAQVLEEWTAVEGYTNLTWVYTWGLGLISQTTLNSEPSTTYYFLPDGHGSTRLLTDNAGTVVNAFSYDAYGTLIASNGFPHTTYLYCGEQWDPDVGMHYLRARYYSPQTGRLWTMDSFEGGQEDPLTLHKYLYCLANPINNRDPNGHEIEGAMTGMSLDFSLNSFTSIPIASSPTAFLSASPWGQGGPDVTTALKNTLNDVEVWYGGLRDPIKKLECAQELRTYQAGDAWDIKQLWDINPPEVNHIRARGKDYETGTGLFEGSVAVNGQVYFASAVNYALFGKECRLAHDYYVSIRDPMEASLYSLTATEACVRFYKRIAYPLYNLFGRGKLVKPEFSYEYGYCAEAFTAWGYNGSSLPQGLPTVPSKDVLTESFDWKWMPHHYY